MQPPSAQAHAALQISRFLPRLSDFLLWRGGCPSSFPFVWACSSSSFFRLAPHLCSLGDRRPGLSSSGRLSTSFRQSFRRSRLPQRTVFLLRSSLLLSFLLSTSIPPFFSSAFLSRVLFSLFSSSSLFLSYQN
uniref:Putative transmembrane protein n=1 Tax=Toxoplasma gondii COUG TaxID=1074873 RepID=A0A2G8XYP9_TOXGO|nr:putative transmembrane protein [Toxoplasma gondii COUG]